MFFILGVVALLFAIRRIWRDQYLGGVDSCFVVSDKHLLINIHTLFELDRLIVPEEFRQFLITDVLKFRRLKQRLVRRTFFWHYWTDDENFDVNNHFYVHILPNNATHQHLEELISKQLTISMKEQHPLWEFHLIQNYNSRSVILYRVHHCVGDGIALMRNALTIFKRMNLSSSMKEEKSLNNTAASASALPTSLQNGDEKRKENASEIENSEKKKATNIEDKKSSKLQPKLSTMNMIKMAIKNLYEILFLPSDPVSIFKTDKEMDKGSQVTARWSVDPIDLNILKRISKKTEMSINDILLSCAANALFNYAKNKDQQTGKQLSKNLKDLQVVLWVSLRGLNVDVQKIEFGNHLGVVYLRLPNQNYNNSNHENKNSPLERLKQIKQITSAAYSSPFPYVSAIIMMIVGLLPPFLSKLIWNASAYKVTISMSNLPGPTYPLQFAGGDVGKFVFFVPPSKTLGHFLTILSYNGKIVFGMVSDRRLIEEPKEIVHLFHEEVDKLIHLTTQ